MPAPSIPQAGLPGLQVHPLTPATQRRIMLVRRHNRALAPLAEYVWTQIRNRFAA